MVRLAVPLDAPTVAVAVGQVRPAVAVGQVSVTAPVKPFDGVTVMTDVVLVPGPAITAAAELSVKPCGGGAVTVTGIVVELVILPVESVPVKYNEYRPGVVVEDETTVNDVPSAAVPGIFTVAGAHVGGETKFFGPVMLQVKVTVPVKPP
jgi:hypothetical protein